MAYIGKAPVNGYHAKQTLTGDGSTVTFSLDQTVASETSIIVSVGGVIQEPKTAYDLVTAGTQITFTAAPASTDRVYIHFLGTAVVQNLLDVNGAEFILDVDGDTSLTADTDDEIDIRVGGTDRSTIKATGFHNIDSIKFVAGTGDDMQMYHDGTNSYLTNATGALKIATETSGIALTIGHTTSEVTVADNMTVTGNLTIGGTTNFGDFDISNVGSIALDTITNDGTDITLDSSGDIVLDAAGNDIFLKDAGTTYGSLTATGSNLIIKSGTTTAATFSGANVTLAGTVGSGNITSTGTVQGTTITATTAFVPDASDGAALGTTALEFSDLFLADSAVINFGDDQDTTLTHTDGSGLTLNSTNKLMFNDASQFIQGASATVLDIAATDEIELTATLIDVVGNFTNSGTIVSAGKITADAGIDIDNFNIDGTTIALSSGDLTVDVAGDIILDAAGDTIFLKDAGTTFGSLDNNSTNLIIKSGTTTALTFSGANVTAAGTIGSGAITSTGIVTGTAFTAGSAVLAEAELELLDGLTAGTAIASKVVTTDASIDTTGQRNLTISGELDAATGDFSGVVDVAGAFTTGSTIVSTGKITSDAGIDIDNFNIDGTTIALSSGDLTVDVAGDIILDAAGDTIFLKDAGTTFGSLDNNSANLIIKSGTTTALTFTGANVTAAGTIGSGAITSTGIVTGTAFTAGSAVLAEAELELLDGITAGTTAASKVFTSDSNNLTAISGAVVLTEDTLSFDATQDWDVRASPVAKVTLTANVTFDAPSNPTTGQYISILCIQDAGGTNTIAWNAVFEFTGDVAPTATTTGARGDLFTFRYNGAKWLEVGRNLNLVLS